MKVVKSVSKFSLGKFAGTKNRHRLQIRTSARRSSPKAVSHIKGALAHPQAVRQISLFAIKFNQQTRFTHFVCVPT